MTKKGHLVRILFPLLLLPFLFGILTSTAFASEDSVPAIAGEITPSPSALDEEEILLSSPTASKSSTALPSHLIPGGIAFGVKMYTRGVTIVGMSDVYVESGVSRCPARECGMEVGDTILSLDGRQVTTVADVTRLIEESGGKSIRVAVSRGKATMDFMLTPLPTSADGVYRAGFWLRDNTSGIGTVTYINPETGDFGGLGHGICDAESGNLIPYAGGVIYDVTISGVVRGKVGIPGEVKGYFNASKTGSLLGNTNAGVFGIFADIPDICTNPLPVAKPGEIKPGKATIRCTLDEGLPREYEIRIDEITMENGNLKNFKITVTDPALLKITGGIVQGMSGSPIMQDGKLIGAVTHVLINNPQKGYGIYIGNMLEAAK